MKTCFITRVFPIAIFRRLASVMVAMGALVTVSAFAAATAAAVQVIFDLATARDPRAKSADPQGFIDARFVRELEQSGAIDQLYAQSR